MKKFIYTADTPCHADLKDDKGETIEISLHQGNSYELPEANQTIKSLIAQGLLIPDKQKNKN